MANFVIKKDGAKEPFDPGKITNAIVASCQGAGLPEQRKNEVVTQVSASVMQALETKEEISTSELKNIILGQLDTVEPTASAAWRKYDETKQTA